MLNLNSVMIGTTQPKVLIDFYKKIFGGNPDMEEGEWAGWRVGNGFISIGEHSEVKGKSKEPQRVLINFETNDVKGEFERIVKSGGVVVKEPYKMEESWIATIADPDGNFFQLMSPWKKS